MSIANTDPANGIHFGFININSCSGEAADDVYTHGCDVQWQNYHERAKAELRSALRDFFSDHKFSDEKTSKLDDAVYEAHSAIEDNLNDAYPGDSEDYEYEKDGYKIQTSFSNTVFAVVRSPFYTFTGLCSPCAPGGGDLNNYREGGLKTYCLGHDWFEDSKAPYPVFKVENDEEVKP